MIFIALKSWEDYQHYKDRDPTWVKLYRDLLTSESWVIGTDLSRLVQVASILLAARYGNKIPRSWNVIRKVTSLDCSEAEFETALAHLVTTNFLEIQSLTSEQESVVQAASSPLAKCSSEKRREEERREEGESARASVSRGATDAGDRLTISREAEEALAEILDSWKRDVEGVNVESLSRFFEFASSHPHKRKPYSSGARLSLAKKLAGMGDLEHQAAVVEQSMSADHLVLYPLKDRPSKHAQDSAKRTQAQNRELELLKVRASKIGFREFDPKIDDIPGYRTLVFRAEGEHADAVRARKRGPAPVAELLGRRQ